MQQEYTAIRYISNKAYKRGLKQHMFISLSALVIMSVLAFNVGRTYEYTENVKKIDGILQQNLKEQENG